jgi:hypothetical protein
MTFAEEFPMLENAEGAIIGVTSDGPFTAYTTKEIEKACLDKERVRQAIMEQVNKITEQRRAFAEAITDVLIDDEKEREEIKFEFVGKENDSISARELLKELRFNDDL